MTWEMQKQHSDYTVHGSETEDDDRINYILSTWTHKSCLLEAWRIVNFKSKNLVNLLVFLI